MSLVVGSTMVTLMKYKVGDIVLVKSSAGDAIPPFHVKLVERIKRKPPKDPEYIMWRTRLTKRKEADKLRKEWQIPFKFPNDIETFILQTNIIRKDRNRNKRNTTRNARNPGTSRRLCRIPISAPLKAARSIAKLLSSACHVAKLRGTAAAIIKRRYSGRSRNLDKFISD